MEEKKHRYEAQKNIFEKFDNWEDAFKRDMEKIVLEVKKEFEVKIVEVRDLEKRVIEIEATIKELEKKQAIGLEPGLWVKLNFDGQSLWSMYKRQLVAAEMNNWNDEERPTVFVVALRGSAF